MELFLSQQFELLLQEAAGNFTERMPLPLRRAGPALAALAEDPDGGGACAAEFVQAFFEENLLDNIAGYCFVLEALERRTLPADPGGPVAEVLGASGTSSVRDVLTTRPPSSSSASRSTPDPEAT